MKGLTIKHPHALLMAMNQKLIETRSRQLSYRGELVLSASKIVEDGDMGLAFDPIFFKAMTSHLDLEQQHKVEWLANRLMETRGHIVAHAFMVDCKPSEYLKGRISEQEYRFGNYEPKRFGYVMERITMLSQPIPIRGNQCLWNVPTDVQTQIRKQINER